MKQRDGMLTSSAHSIDAVERTILTHFKINDRLELLEVFYGLNAAKSKIASLCTPLAKCKLFSDVFFFSVLP